MSERTLVDAVLAAWDGYEERDVPEDNPGFEQAIRLVDAMDALSAHRAEGERAGGKPPVGTIHPLHQSGEGIDKCIHCGLPEMYWMERDCIDRTPAEPSPE